MALILVLVNKSNLADISDYDGKVLIGDGTATGSKVIATGHVKGHVRSDGWQKLVEKFLDAERTKLISKPKF